MEEFIQEIMGGYEADLNQTLEGLRKKEFNYAVNELKQRLVAQQRCVVCTLPLPCPHFTYPEELPAISLPTKEEFSLHHLTEGLDTGILNVAVNPKDYAFTVKFKPGKNKYVMSTSPRYKHAVPSTTRLRTMEQVEAYREEKLKKELERIQQIKDKEEEQKRKLQAKEERRIKRAQRLKEQLDKYRDDISQRKELLEKERADELRKYKAKEERHRQYLEEQKKKLTDYHDKKRVNDVIIKQQVEQLQDQTLKYDPRQIYLN